MDTIDGSKIHPDFDEFYSLSKKRQGIGLQDNYSPKKAAKLIRDSLEKIEGVRMPNTISESNNSAMNYREIGDCDVEIYRNNDYSFTLHSEPSHLAYGLIIKIIRHNLSDNTSRTLFERKRWATPLEVDSIIISPVVNRFNNVLSFELAYDISAEAGIPNASFYEKDVVQISSPFMKNAFCDILSSTRCKEKTKPLIDWAITGQSL